MNNNLSFSGFIFFISAIKGKSEVTSSIFYVCFINDLIMDVGAHENNQ